MRHAATALLAAILLGPVAAAQDAAPPSADAVAEQVVAADASGDMEVVAALARLDPPSPWLVVDALESRRAVDAARAYAERVPEGARPPLEAYARAIPPTPRGEAARRTYEQALGSAEELDPTVLFDGPRAPPRGTVLEVRCLELVAGALRARRRFADAGDAYERACRAAGALGWSAQERDLLREAADAAANGSSYVAARSRYEELLALISGGADPTVAAECRLNLGSVAATLGDYPTAQRHLEAARDAFRAGEELARALDAESRLADVLALTGRYADALRMQRRALEGLERAFPSRAEVVESRLRLGTLHFEMADFERAASAYEAALTGARDLQDAELEATAIANGALALHQLGRGDEARSRWGEARDILDAHGAVEEVAYVDLAVADAAVDDGRAAEARGAAERAATALERLGLQAGAVSAQTVLGRADLAQGDAPAAVRRLRAALAEAERIQAFHAALEARSSLVVALARGGAGREAAAEALRVGTDVAGAGVDLPTARVVAAPTKIEAALEAGAGAAFDTGDVGQLQQILEAIRAFRLARALGGRDRVRAAVVPSDVLAKEATARAAELDALRRYREGLSAGAERPQLLPLRQAYEAARAATQAVFDAFETESRGRSLAGLLTPTRVSIAQVQARLAPHEALVYYATVAERALAVVVTKSAARAVATGGRDEVLDRVASIDPDAPSAEIAKAASAVSARLVGTLALPASVTRVYVCPDAITSHVPWAALDATRAYALVPSATLWLALHGEGRRRGRNVLAFADPAYPKIAPATTTGAREPAQTLVRLPGTVQEARAVTRNERDVVVTGADCTLARVRTLLGPDRTGRWSAVHFACHGLVDRLHPEQSALALTPGPEDDGLLRALDVFRLRADADLVVLSACDSGADRHVPGEGLAGLVRAFFYAGTPRVVASLWRASDDLTPAFMRDFYGRVAAGTPTPEALRAAQQAAAQEGKPARAWAPWVVWGVGE